MQAQSHSGDPASRHGYLCSLADGSETSQSHGRSQDLGVNSRSFLRDCRIILLFFLKSHRSKTKVKQFPLLICSLTHQQTIGFYPDILTWKPSSDPDTRFFTTLCNGWENILPQFICSTKEGRNHLLHQLTHLKEMDKLQGTQTLHQIFSKQLKPPDGDQFSSAKSRVLSVTAPGDSAPSLFTSWVRRTKWQIRHGEKNVLSWITAEAEEIVGWVADT